MSREGLPHVRVPDQFYRLFKFFRPTEIHLLLALSCITRRVGQERGLVKKSLREIARDIGMPWSVARRAWKGLEELEFVGRDKGRLHVESNPFARALATDIATFEKRRSGPLAAHGDGRSGPLEAHGDGRSGPPGTSSWAAGNVVLGRWRPTATEKPNGPNGLPQADPIDPLDPARAFQRARAPVPNFKIVKSPPLTRVEDSLAPGWNACENGDRGKEGANVSDAGDGGLEARWLNREEMTETMRKIRQKIAEGEAARARELEKARGPRPLHSGTSVYPVEEEERREELRRQADELREGDAK